MACYGCGSSEGNEVRLCSRCVQDRKAHRDGYVEEQRKTIGVGEYGRPFCPRALLIILGIRMILIAFCVVGLVAIALVVVYGAPEIQQRIESGLPLGGVLTGFPHPTQIVIACGLWLLQMAVDMVALILLFKMQRLGAYLSIVSIAVGELFAVLVGAPRSAPGLLLYILWLLPFLWWSQLVPRQPVHEEYIAPRNTQGRAVRDGWK